VGKLKEAGRFDDLGIYENIILKQTLKGIGAWINLARDMENRRSVAKMAMNPGCLLSFVAS
jgi:hypothetical protein